MQFNKFSPAEHRRRERERRVAEQLRVEREAAAALAREQQKQLRAMLAAQKEYMLRCAEARVAAKAARRAAFIQQVKAEEEAKRLATPRRAPDGRLVRLRRPNK